MISYNVKTCMVQENEGKYVKRSVAEDLLGALEDILECVCFGRMESTKKDSYIFMLNSEAISKIRKVVKRAKTE